MLFGQAEGHAQTIAGMQQGWLAIQAHSVKGICEMNLQWMQGNYHQNWRQAGTLMGLVESALASCHKMKGLMIVGLAIGIGFGGAVTDDSGAFELKSFFGVL